MAVTIAELIAKREDIAAKKKQLYDIETSIGEIVVKPPSGTLVAESWAMKSDYESNKYLVHSCIVNPNLRDGDLLKAYNCVEPTDIVDKIFESGEVNRLAVTLLRLGGFRNNELVTKLHDESKNS